MASTIRLGPSEQGPTVSPAGLSSSLTLQAVYDNGNTIDVTAASGTVLITGQLSEATAPFSVLMGVTEVLGVNALGGGILNAVSGQDLEIETSGIGETGIAGGTGGISLTSAGNVDLQADLEILFTDAGLAQMSFSQTGDRSLDLTAVGELYFGITSIVGALNAAGNAVASSGTLQETYVLGSSIATTVAQGPIAFSNAVDTQNLLSLTRSFAGLGHALAVVMDAAATGNGIDIDFNSTAASNVALNITMDALASADAIAVTHDGSVGAVLKLENSLGILVDIDAAGSITIAGNSGSSVLLTAEGVGTYSAGTVGTGDANFVATGGGDVLLQASAGSASVRAFGLLGNVAISSDAGTLSLDSDLAMSFDGDTIAVSAVNASTWTAGGAMTVNANASLTENVAGAYDLTSLLATGKAIQIVAALADMDIVSALGLLTLEGATLALTSNTGDMTIDAAGAMTLQQAASARFAVNSSGRIDITPATGQELRLGTSGTNITRVLGNLVVDGETVTVESEVMLADNYIFQNFGYTTTTAQTAGQFANVLPLATNDTVAGNYTAGVAAVSNPTVITTGTATFSAGQFVQKIRSRIDDITIAANKLDTLSRQTRDDDVAVLAREVAEAGR